MKTPGKSSRGYSMIELLVVLAIVGILAFVGVSMIGSRPSSAVRGTLDELEGVIAGAQKLSVATGQDVYLVADGTWDPTSASYFVLAYDTVRAVDRAANPGNPDVAARARIVAQARAPLADGTDPSGVFRVSFNPTTKALVQDHAYTGVATGDWPASWYTTALGSTTALTAISPGNAAPFAAALAGGNQLCKTVTNFVIVSGLNKRFASDFFICVVGIRSGNAVPKGPLGFLVVPANSASIYKFYNPGTVDNDGQWRRL